MKRLMTEIARRLKALMHWLFVQPWPFWTTVAIPIVLIWLSTHLSSKAELNTRIAGYCIALCGIGLVSMGIHDTRKLFNRPSMAYRFQQWAKQLPSLLFRPMKVQGVIITAQGGSIASGVGNVTLTLGPAASLESRIALLEAGMKVVQARVDSTETRLSNEVNELQSIAARNRQALEEADRELRERLEKYSAGGLDFKSIGVVWFIIGEALTTFPDEIARFLL